MLKKTIKAIAPILNVSQSGWKGVRIWALICIIGFFFLYLRLGYFRTAASSASGVDPVYYFIYLPSVVFDHDLDFTNQLIRMHGTPDRFIPLKPGALPATLWAPGSALLWLPFYLAGHAFALVLNSPQFPADGYSGIYQGFVYTGNTILALLGIFFLIEFLKLYLNPLAALAGTLSVLACSFFAFYMMPPYLDSSAASFASASLFLFLAAQKKRAFWTGAVAGLMVVVRNQSAILLLVYATISLGELYNVRKSRSLTLDWCF